MFVSRTLTCVPGETSLRVIASERQEALVLTQDGKVSVRAATSDEIAFATQSQTTTASAAAGEESELLDGSAAAIQHVHGVIGVMEMFQVRFAIVASEVVQQGELRKGERVLRIVRSDLIRIGAASLVGAHLSDAERAALRAAVEHVVEFLNGDELHLHCSPDFDVTRRTVDRMRAPAAPSDDLFCWNAAWTRELRRAAPAWVVPIVDGFFKSEALGATSRFVLWARRSALAQGARYFARGVTLPGNVANMVETEQMLVAGERTAVFTVIRGSIPIWWHQQGGELFKPPPVPFVAARTQAALRRHVDSLVAAHGQPLVIVSLIDLVGAEGVLATHFREAVQLAADERVVFHEFDFHEKTKGSKYDNVNELLALLLPRIAASGLTLIDEAGRVVEAQNGVVRVNCVDCLDRTNVVQTMVAQRALDAQAAKLNLGAVRPEVTRRAWSEQADALSMAYTSASALKTDFTRTGKRSLAGVIGDSLTSVRRLMNRAFTDDEKQEMLDTFLAQHSLVSAHGMRSRFAALTSWKARSSRNTEVALALDRAAGRLLVADAAEHKLYDVALADVVERVWPDVNQPTKLWLALNQFCPPRTACAALSKTTLSNVAGSSSGDSGGSAAASTGAGGATAAADESEPQQQFKHDGKRSNYLQEYAMDVTFDSVMARQACMHAIGAASPDTIPAQLLCAVSIDLDRSELAGVKEPFNPQWAIKALEGGAHSFVSVAVFAAERAAACANALRVPLQRQLGAEWQMCARHTDEPGNCAVLLFARGAAAALVSNIELSHVRTVSTKSSSSSGSGATASSGSSNSRKFGGIRDRLKQATDMIKGQSSGGSNRTVVGVAVTFALGDWLRVGVLAYRDDRNRDVDACLSNGTLLDAIDVAVFLTSSGSRLPDTISRRDAWQFGDSGRRIAFLSRVDGSATAPSKSVACDVLVDQTDSSLCSRVSLVPIVVKPDAPIATDLSLALKGASLAFDVQLDSPELTVIVFARCLAVGVAVRPTRGAGDSWALPSSIELELATPLAVAARSRIHVEVWNRRSLVGFGCAALSTVLTAGARQTCNKAISIDIVSKALVRRCTLRATLDARWPAAEELSLQRRQSKLGLVNTFVPGASDMRSSLGADVSSQPAVGDLLDVDFLRMDSTSPQPPQTTAPAAVPPAAASTSTSTTKSSEVSLLDL
jgi:hypothetical protein